MHLHVGVGDHDDAVECHCEADRIVIGLTVQNVPGSSARLKGHVHRTPMQRAERIIGRWNFIHRFAAGSAGHQTGRRIVA